MSADNNAADKKKSSLILYIGSDQGLFSLLKSYFFKVLGNGVAIESLSYKNKSEIQRLALTIHNRRPKLIIVDLSVDSKEMLHLIRIVERMNFFPKTSVIGVTDATQSGSLVKEAVMAGINSVHVKSGEVDGIGFNCVALAFSEKAKEHAFAKAKMVDQALCYVPAKVCKVNEDYISVESNFKTTVGNYYFLETKFSKNDMLISSLMKCRATRKENLFYNYEYAHDLHWPELNSPSLPTSMEGQEEEIEEPAESEEALEHEEVESPSISYEDYEEQVKNVTNWIDENKSQSSPKPIKALIIDRQLKLLDSTRLSDDFGYVIRCQPFLMDPENKLRVVKPQIIFFEHEELPDDVSEEEKIFFNTYSQLKELFKAIKEIENYHPIVIVSNINKTTLDIQKREDYTKTIAYQESISTELIDSMASKLKEKLEGEFIREDEIVLNKDSKYSYSEFKINIELTNCSELDLRFTSTEKFALGTNLRLEFPVPMFVSIAPDPSGSNNPEEYYGLINAIKAEDQMALRRYINSVFFREKEAAKAQEAAEIEAKKQKYVEDKKKAEEEAIRKKKEEEEKKKKDEEEKLRKEQEAKESTDTDEEVVEDDS